MEMWDDIFNDPDDVDPDRTIYPEEFKHGGERTR